MGPDARSVPPDSDRDHETVDVTHPMVVMIEQDHTIRSGRLLELGRRRARVRTRQSLRDGEALVLTISVPESSSEKTQAMFRLSSRARLRNRDARDRHDYVLHFSTENDNLVTARKLYARFRAKGIVEV